MARAGDVVGGKYRLIHPLGIGGMGTVWRAEHQALKQQVAIKLLHVRGPQADRTIKRFQREAQIAASIRHRNIVYISDFGTDGDEPYIVMELLQGVPLSERMVVGEPLSVGTFMYLVDETLQGLAAVHAGGVVHRDMKPENIFLVHDASGGVFPKLLDFGVSRSTERNAGHTITREGIVMGTPEYVSPEQARGRMADVRSDIYSVGVVMYEALSGRLPFSADNPADLIVAVLNNTPLPLDTFRPELGRGLSELVHKAMERNPDARFQTAEEMRTALSTLRAYEPELDALYLPRRFLAPSEYPAPLSEAPPAPHDLSSPGITASEPAAGPGEIAHVTMEIARFTRRRASWIASALAIAAVIGLGFALSGGESKAGAPGSDGARTRAPAAPVTPPTPPAPQEVIVELNGVPDDAVVRSDGVLTGSGSLRFPRDTGLHMIVVEAPGKLPFRVAHDSSRDGRYTISLASEKKVKRPAAKPAAPKKPGLLRRPDF
ncbi:MAG: serine/threonine-protein kinase [Polyangiales bacterium]